MSLVAFQTASIAVRYSSCGSPCQNSGSCLTVLSRSSASSLFLSTYATSIFLRRRFRTFFTVGQNTDSLRSDGHPTVVEVPVTIGGPLRTRTVDPLIKSDSERISTEAHDDVRLEDLYTCSSAVAAHARQRRRRQTGASCFPPHCPCYIRSD